LPVTDASFTDWLRRVRADAWTSARSQRFITDVVADRLPPTVFERYVAIEYDFVDTAARVLARTVEVAPSFAARGRLARGLHGLVTDQYEWFHDLADRRGIDLSGNTPDGARGLHDHVLEVAGRGDYAELLGAQLGAEWLYADWCSEAQATTIGDRDLRAWIALHTTEDFTDHVRWLRDELGRVGPSLDAAAVDRISAAFAGTLYAEVPFHDAAYESEAAR
jgi:thiaminase/transcriptional activator TenA